MYSKAAIEMYAALLKEASSTIDVELEKNAGLRDLLSTIGRGFRGAGPAIDTNAGRTALYSGSLIKRLPDPRHVSTAVHQATPMGGKFLAGAALGGAALGTGGYMAGKNIQHEQDKTQRNMAFGAGAAAGLAAPSVLRGLSNTAQNFATSNLLPGRY